MVNTFKRCQKSKVEMCMNIDDQQFFTQNLPNCLINSKKNKLRHQKLSKFNAITHRAIDCETTRTNRESTERMQAVLT
jgi:hypothetical protein